MLQFTFGSQSYISVPPNQNSFKVVYQLPNGIEVMLDHKEVNQEYYSAHEVVEDTNNCAKIDAHLLS